MLWAFPEACVKLGTATQPGNEALDLRMAAATSHRESALTCGVPKNLPSPQQRQFEYAYTFILVGTSVATTFQ